MSRVQPALNVDDLDAAVEFYSKLFGTEPAKRRDGYANFAIAEPPLKLVLFEQPGTGGTINHLGVEVESTDLVDAAQARLADAGLATATATEDGVACCYARQDKVWVDGPGSRGRSTRCSRTWRCPPVRCARWSPGTGAVCCATVDEDGLVTAGSAACC